MNNKVATYFLITAVIFIWGFVGYKIYSTLKNDNIDNRNQVNVERKKEIKTDTFSLLLSYSDPFTKTVYQGITVNTNAVNIANHTSFNINKPATMTQNIQEINPVNIKYFGLVKNELRKTGMLSINNKSYIVYEGQKIDSIKIIKISKDQLSYKDKKNKLSTISIK